MAKTKPGQSDEDATLGGYMSVHSRPPAFEGCDGQPYTVSIETERSADLRAPVAGYLVFPKWASSGLGIVGHVESPLLWRGPTQDAVTAEAGGATLRQVQQWLNEAIVAAVGGDEVAQPKAPAPEEG